MKWYEKYMQVFNRSPRLVSVCARQEIAKRLSRFNPDNPLVSVVLIAYNEETRILGCLWSLADNICDFPVEIIVVNNNSTDETANLLDEVHVNWYMEKRKGPGFARQCGLNHARGTYHICVDSDTLYPPHYIETHVKALRKTDVVCSYALWSFLPENRWHKVKLTMYEFLRDIYLSLLNVKRPELCVRGMTLGFRTDLGRKVGYNTRILRGEDGTMALNLKSFGKLKFMRSGKARPITCCTTLYKGGGIWKNLFSRAWKALVNVKVLFTTQRHYEDRDYNLINKISEAKKLGES